VCWCASHACDVRHSDGDMLAIVLVASSAMMTASGHANSRSPFWVTKILSGALDDYVPDGGTACRRHGLQYRDELAGLKLWATRSKTISNNESTSDRIERKDRTPFSVRFRSIIFRALRTKSRLPDVLPGALFFFLIRLTMSMLFDCLLRDVNDWNPFRDSPNWNV